MKHMCVFSLCAVLASVFGVLLFSDSASAYYHPSLGRWMSRDPGAEVEDSMLVGATGPSVGGRFIPRDQYVDGMNLYQYVCSAPVDSSDPRGTEATSARDPCCAVINGTRMHLHATVEAKKPPNKIRNIYASPEDSDVGTNPFYPHDSEVAYIGITEGRPGSDTCIWSATVEGWTGPAPSWKDWKFQLSAEARYTITLTNVTCQSERLHVTCSGTASDLGVYWCPPDATYIVPKGESRYLEEKPWVGLSGWVKPAEEHHKGVAWIVLTVRCEGS
jgi:hypothetical protein